MFDNLLISRQKETTSDSDEKRPGAVVFELPADSY